MHKEESPSFLTLLNKGSAVCAFHPKDRHLFALGGGKSQVIFGNALLKHTVTEVTLPSSSTQRHVNGIKFMPDGKKIVTSCHARRLSVIDVERGDVIINYENCAYPASGRQPVVSHHDVPHLAACLTVNGKGITLFDLRMPLPLDLILDLYDSPIRDLCFVDGSWPWGSGQVSILSGGVNQCLKVNGISGRTIATLPSIGSINTLAISPGTFKSSKQSNFPSVILTGGEALHSMIPENLDLWEFESGETFKSIGGKVLKAVYSCSGGILYTATKGGNIVRYRRYPNRHELIGTLYSHKEPVTDLAISTHGEYLLSTSQDGTVGITLLGTPCHGWVQYYELT